MNVNVLSPEQQARQLASQGQYRAAADLLHVVLQQQPTASAWALWASLQLQLGDEGQAIEGYRRALNLCPSEQTWETCLDDLWKRQRLRKQDGNHAAQGHERLQQGRAVEASALLQEALQAQETAEIWNDWASAEFLQGHRVEAEGGFRRALALDPAHRAAAGNLGRLLHHEERHEEAIPWLRRAWQQAPESEQLAWSAALAECQREVETRGSTATVPSATAGISEMLLRMQEAIAQVRGGVEDLRRQMSKRPAEEESLNVRTVLERRPLGQIIPAVTSVRLVDPATAADGLPLVDRWLLGTLAGLYGGAMLQWGAKNAITLDLAGNAPAGSVVWHVAGSAPGFDPLEPARLGAERAVLTQQIHLLPIQSVEFRLADWAGRMSLVVIESHGTAENVRAYTRSALPFLASAASVAIWFGYGRWRGVTEALNELYLSVPGFESLVHVAESDLALLPRPAGT